MYKTTTPTVATSPTPPVQPTKSYGRNWKKWVPIYLIIAAVLYGGFYYFVLAKQNSKPYSQPVNKAKVSPTPDATANWKTHTDSLCNYSVKYPSDWRLETLQNTNTFLKTVRAPQPTGPFEQLPETVFIDFFCEKNVDNLNIDTWVANEVEKRKLEGFVPQIISLNVAGEKALKTTLPSRFGEDLIVFFHGNTIYKIHTEPITKEDREIVESTRDQILQTFKFTEQNQTMNTAQIKLSCAQKLNIPLEKGEITIKESIKGQYAKGDFIEKGAKSGVYFLAAKINDKWICTTIGNGIPECSEINPYNYPQQMVSSCTEGNTLITR